MKATKAELTAQRADLIRRLSTKITPSERNAINETLSAIKAQLKTLNIAEAAELKARADEKKRAGLAQQAADTARAVERADKADEVTRRANPQKPGKPPPTRGEFILHRARQLAKLIAAIPEDKRKEYTAAFYGQLTAFVTLQTVVVDAERKATNEAREKLQAEWSETWKAEGAAR